MTSTQPAIDGEAEAQRLVGMFLQSFAILEQALDAGIGKLLGLEGNQNDIVCSSIPFAKKLGVFFSAEGLMASAPDQERKDKLRSIRGEMLGMNLEYRVMFAHNPFVGNEQGGVSFRRVVADKKLDVYIRVFTSDFVKDLSDKAKELARQIEELVTAMEPYAPSMDLSDPRNSMYLPAIS